MADDSRLNGRPLNVTNCDVLYDSMNVVTCLILVTVQGSFTGDLFIKCVQFNNGRDVFNCPLLQLRVIGHGSF